MEYGALKMELKATIRGIFAGFLICSVVFFSAAQAASGKKVNLRYTFKPGQKLTYGMNIDGTVTVKVKRTGESQVPQNTASLKGTFGYTQEVVDVNQQDKSATLKVTYAASELQTKVGDQVIPNQDVTALAGKTALLRVATNGNVLSQEIPQALPPTFQNADFTKMFVIFPEQEIGVGETWGRDGDKKVDENENFRTESLTKAVYTLAGIEKKNRVNCAKIEIKTTTSATTTSKRPDLKFSGKMSGRVEGAVYYDLNTGFAVVSDLTVWVSNEVSTEAPQGLGAPVQTVTMLETSLRTVTERR